MDSKAYNGELRRDIQEITKEVKECKTGISRLETTLSGDPEKGEPNGLIHLVFRNTQFRKIASKVLWLMSSILLAVLLEKLFKLLN